MSETKNKTTGSNVDLDSLPVIRKGVAKGKGAKATNSSARKKKGKVTQTFKRQRARVTRLAESEDSLSDEVETVVIGLDISSRVVGVCAVHVDDTRALTKPLLITWIKLHNLGDFWERARKVEEVLEDMRDKLTDDVQRAAGKAVRFRVGYEEPLERLSGGSGSSSGTITKLARFNGMVGLVASQVFCDDAPDGFTVHEARKLAGIKLRRGKGVKTPHKEQVFQQVVQIVGDSWVVKRTKRTGEEVPRDECLDASDAWVVAAAYYNSLRKHLG